MASTVAEATSPPQPRRAVKIFVAVGRVLGTAILILWGLLLMPVRCGIRLVGCLEARFTVASLLWLPYSYVIVTSISTGTILALESLTGHAVGTALLGAGGDMTLPAVHIPLLVLGGLALGGASAGASAGAIDGDPWFRSIVWGALWGLALPARLWARAWSVLMKLLFTRFFWALLAVVVIEITAFVVASLVQLGLVTGTWALVLLAILIPGMSFVFVRWGNQYGSGVKTDGLSGFGCSMVMIGIVFGLAGWCAAVLTAGGALIAPIGSYFVIAAALDFEMFPWQANLIPFAILAVPFFLAPFITDAVMSRD